MRLRARSIDRGVNEELVDALHASRIGGTSYSMGRAADVHGFGDSRGRSVGLRLLIDHQDRSDSSRLGLEVISVKEARKTLGRSRRKTEELKG